VLSRSLTQGFPLWALLLAAVAYQWPQLFQAGGAAIVPLLMLVMFGMGATLTPADFKTVAGRGRLVALGLALQYTVMPAAAWCVAALLGLPPELAVGVYLVGATSGGTASNLVTYLARGDVALSVTMTALSTLLAIFMMPLLLQLLLGRAVDVPERDLVLTVAQLALGPVIAGMLLRRALGPGIARVEALLPAVSSLSIVLIIAIIVALNAPRLATVGGSVVAAVVLHNAIGLGAGYALARLARADRRSARTIAIEVGMQNSGLAVALALKLFTPVAALPGALFSVWHNVSGALLASWWSRRDP
jgi:BASS family bile acid:Na+ symporter